MAAFDFVANMYDGALKPRLLRTLLREHVLEEKHPFRNSSELSKVVSMIKAHSLLSESLSSMDQKVMDSWKSAVDSWVDRLLLLLSSNMPDKRWVGICLLGLTCQECSSDRFLASYSDWFHKLLPHIQSPAGPHFLKVASCASMSDLFTRLGGFQNAKKDGTSCAGKLIQSVLKLLNDDSSESVWEVAVHLLSTIITFFPFSIHRCYDSVEAAIASKILSGKCSTKILKMLAHCLALLPKSKGDEDSWSLLMQKILLLINSHLTDVFQGVDEDTKGNEVVKLLIPPGKDPPPRLGCHSFSREVSDKIGKKSERLLTSSVSTLMLCCSTMLTSSFPCQVAVPVRSLLALIERVLVVDGSLPRTSLPFMTAMQQELVCLDLPVLHSYSLELLIAVIKALRSQLLPHAAFIVRLITAYLKRCALAELRVKAYSITKLLMISMGVGMAVFLAQEVTNNAFDDLNSIGNEISDASSAKSKATTVATLQPCRKKSKHYATTGSLEKQQEGSDLSVENNKNRLNRPITVKIAAIQALEALLNVGGALKSEAWRSHVEHILVTIATNSLKGGWANEATGVWADFQLSALRALLASLLSSAHVRPAYLSQSLELFHEGQRETGTQLAEFCAHALLALEVLIHPRELPLADFVHSNSNSFEGVNRKIPENIYSDGLNHSKSPTNDPLNYNTWLENGTDTEVPSNDLEKDKNHSEESSDISRVPHAEKHDYGGPQSAITSERSALEPEAAITGMGMRDNVDELMVGLSAKFQESMPSKGLTVPSDIPLAGAVVSGNGVSSQAVVETASREDVLMIEGDELASKSVARSPTSSESGENDEFKLAREQELSRDSLPDDDDGFPDIVDEDPDSDYE